MLPDTVEGGRQYKWRKSYPPPPGGEEIETRTHLSLHKDAPLGRAVQRYGKVVATPVLSELHHRYTRI
jgi:hypothetical protein